MVVERLLPAAMLVIAAVGAPLLIFSGEGLPRLRALDSELSAVRKENDDERRQIGFLRKNVQKLKDEPATVERIARDELGLVRRNEVVFQFPQTPQSAPTRGRLTFPAHGGATALV
jgi:cell division protein FtsB